MRQITEVTVNPMNTGASVSLGRPTLQPSVSAKIISTSKNVPKASAPIAKALVAAHERGVRVEAILDKTNLTDKYTNAPYLAKAGIPIKIDSAHAIAHNKVMIIDNDIVVSGSFNFTKAAEERNAENLLIIHSKELSARYLGNWRAHQKHSIPYSLE